MQCAQCQRGTRYIWFELCPDTQMACSALRRLERLWCTEELPLHYRKAQSAAQLESTSLAYGPRVYTTLSTFGIVAWASIVLKALCKSRGGGGGGAASFSAEFSSYRGEAHFPAIRTRRVWKISKE